MLLHVPPLWPHLPLPFPTRGLIRFLVTPVELQTLCQDRCYSFLDCGLDPVTHSHACSPSLVTAEILSPSLSLLPRVSHSLHFLCPMLSYHLNCLASLVTYTIPCFHSAAIHCFWGHSRVSLFTATSLVSKGVRECVVETVRIISAPHAECCTARQLRLPSSLHTAEAVGPICVCAAFTSPVSEPFCCTRCPWQSCEL